MRVVHVQDREGTHYIGRYSSFRRATPNAVFANLGNPVHLHRDTPRERATVLAAYEELVRSGYNGDLERIKALPKDAVLECFCHPKACHGDVIIKLWKEFNGSKK